jgi:hypothetical protein
MNVALAQPDTLCTAARREAGSTPTLLRTWRVGVLTLFALFYLAIPNARPDFTALYTVDSDHYLALAYNLAHGHGYTRSLPPADFVPHRTWPPGFPLMLVPAMWLTGPTMSWFAAKATMALLGIGGGICAWFLMRRLSGSKRVADVAVLLLLANPFYWHFSHIAMAEIPYLLWMLLGLLLIDLVWAGRRVRPWEAIALGLFAGLGMLIKGYCLGLIIAPLAYLVGRRRTAGSRSAQLLACGLYMLAFVIPQFGWMARNSTVEASGVDGVNQVRMLRQTSSCDPDSGLLGVGDSLRTVADNVRHHLIYRFPEQLVPGMWALGDWTWPGSGWLALLLSAALLGAFIPWRGDLTSLHLALVPVVGLILILPEGYLTYYWVAASMLLGLAVLLGVTRSTWVHQWNPGWALVLVAVLLVNLLGYVIIHERRPYTSNEGYDYAELAQLYDEVRADGLQTQGVFAPRGEAFQLWTGCPAPLPIAENGRCYQHCIVRDDWDGPRAPEGAVRLLSAGPWVLYELPRLMSAEELLPMKHGLYARNATMSPRSGRKAIDRARFYL